MNRDDLFYSSNRGKKMKKLIGTLAVLICFIFMLEGCGLKKVKSGAPEDYYMNDMVISPQQAEDNAVSFKARRLMASIRVYARPDNNNRS